MKTKFLVVLPLLCLSTFAISVSFYLVKDERRDVVHKKPVKVIKNFVPVEKSGIMKKPLEQLKKDFLAIMERHCCVDDPELISETNFLNKTEGSETEPDTMSNSV